MWVRIAAAPALTPMAVTLEGFPPKAAMWRFSQRKAQRWSRRELLPG